MAESDHTHSKPRDSDNTDNTSIRYTCHDSCCRLHDSCCRYHHGRRCFMQADWREAGCQVAGMRGGQLVAGCMFEGGGRRRLLLDARRTYLGRCCSHHRCCRFEYHDSCCISVVWNLRGLVYQLSPHLQLCPIPFPPIPLSTPHLTSVCAWCLLYSFRHYKPRPPAQ